MTCHAIQRSDQMMCGQCGLQWDTNDPDPPACQGDVAVEPPNIGSDIRFNDVPVTEHNLQRATWQIEYRIDRAPGLIRYLAGFVAIEHAEHNTKIRYTHYDLEGRRERQVEVLRNGDGGITRRSRVPEGDFWGPWMPLFRK